MEGVHVDFLHQGIGLTAQIGVTGIEWIILLIIIAIVLLLGPTKLPELARGIGKAIGEFRRGKMEIEKELKKELAQTPSAAGVQTVVEISPRIVDAAKELGIDILDKKERDLKVAIIRSLDTAAEDKLSSVARALGLRVEGLDLDQLKDKIIQALGV
jgi:sec-independent protein translocase protein TatA